MDFFDKQIDSENDLIDFFISAINYRNIHKDESDKIAQYVFDASFADKLDFNISKDVIRLRHEFGALEAPGVSENDKMPQEDFEDMLWNRLCKLILKSKEKRAV